MWCCCPADFGRIASVAGRHSSRNHSYTDSQAASDSSLRRVRRPSILGLLGSVKDLVMPDNGDDDDDQQHPEHSLASSGMAQSDAVLLDLGFYLWKSVGADEPIDTSGMVPEAAEAAKATARQMAVAAAAEGGLLHLVQVQNKRMAPRMLLFDWPLKACEGEDALLQQLLPGFMDAPGGFGWEESAQHTRLYALLARCYVTLHLAKRPFTHTLKTE